MMMMLNLIIFIDLIMIIIKANLLCLMPDRTSNVTKRISVEDRDQKVINSGTNRD